MILCINAATSGVAEWSLDWLGLGVLDGVVYGLVADELVTLDGSAEDGFSASIKTGRLRLDGHTEYNAQYAYFEIDAGAEASLTTYNVSVGGETSREYTLAVRAEDGTDAPVARTEQLAKGLRGAHWSFQLAGADWNLSGWHIGIEQLSKVGMGNGYTRSQNA